MSDATLIQVITDTITLVFFTAAPLLTAAMAIGISVSIFQVVTSIQDMTLTFVPKMIVVCLITLFLLPWIARMIVDFTRTLFGQFAMFAQ